jgi:hypothetical protein
MKGVSADSDLPDKDLRPAYDMPLSSAGVSPPDQNQTGEANPGRGHYEVVREGTCVAFHGKNYY